MKLRFKGTSARPNKRLQLKPPKLASGGEEVCPDCHGSGKINGHQCDKCHGTGHVPGHH